MITKKALAKVKVLVFWEKHGLEATLDAFPHKRSTLFAWKQQWIKGGKKIDALNEKKKTPQEKRKRSCPPESINEIRRIRNSPNSPNLGPEKIYPLLLGFCMGKRVACLKIRTIPTDGLALVVQYRQIPLEP